MTTVRRTIAPAIACLVVATTLAGCGSQHLTTSAVFTKITGVVTDPQGAGIAGAMVSIGGGGATTTDSQGRYTLSGSWPGTATINVSIAGATLALRTVTLQSLSGDLQTAEVDIQLSPAALATSVTIRGLVVDSIAVPIPGVVVTVAGGAGATATSDAGGHFTLPGTFAGSVTLNASKDGYFTSTSATTVTPVPISVTSVSVTIHLEAPNLAQLADGAYDLTLAIDSSCGQFPADQGTQAFPATVTATQGQFGVSSYRVSSKIGTLPLGVLGPQISISSHLTSSPTSDSLLSIGINGTTSIDTPQPQAIMLPFAGTWEYCAGKPGALLGFDQCPIEDSGLLVSHAVCTASNHLLTLVRK